MPIKYQSQLCASSELTQISDKLHTITAVESTIVVTITKLQITNINKFAYWKCTRINGLLP